MIHPILDALDGSEQAWLKGLLFTFNEGNIGKFEALGPRLGEEVCLVRQFAFDPVLMIHIYPKPILSANYAFLRQKICLMALMEAVFKRTANNRSMTFQTIAEEVRLPRDEVEHLVMKALRSVAYNFISDGIFMRMVLFRLASNLFGERLIK